MNNPLLYPLMRSGIFPGLVCILNFVSIGALTALCIRVRTFKEAAVARTEKHPYEGIDALTAANLLYNRPR